MKYNQLMLQEHYCETRGLEVLVPEERCWSCGHVIWEKITDIEASSRHITSCPFCCWSFCE
jgi:hypothetical protein